MKIIVNSLLGTSWEKTDQDWRRGASVPRREEGAYYGYATDEQQRQWRWIGAKMVRFLPGSALLLVMLCSLPSNAGARQDVSSAADKKARELYLVGEQHYAAGHYEQAAKHFAQSYQLSGRPALLFNLANAHERMSDYGRAAEYLKQYLAKPGARNVDSIRERISRLEAAAKRREQELRLLRQAKTPSPTSAPAAEPTANHQVVKRSAPSRLPMYLLWAGGAASLAGALAFGLLALNAGEDADTACSADGFCPETARSAVDREQGFAIATDVSLAVGVIAAGVGTYLWFRNRRRSVQTIEARISPMPTGAALSLSAPF